MQSAGGTAPFQPDEKERMRITVTVKPGSSKPGVEKLGDGTFTVRVSEPARDGLANRAVILALAEELSVAKSRIRIVRGESSRIKMFEID